LTDDQGLTTGFPKRDLRQSDEDKEAPRYQIDIRGLASYRMLTESNRTAIRAMIDGTKNYIFNNHTRKDGLASLRQMLPVLTGHRDATAWFGGLPGQNVDRLGTAMEGMSIGDSGSVASIDSPQPGPSEGSGAGKAGKRKGKGKAK